jgi:hypothetical protein
MDQPSRYTCILARFLPMRRGRGGIRIHERLSPLLVLKRWASGHFSLKPLFIKGLRRFETRESPECPLTAYSFRIRFLEGQICTQSARDCLSDGNPPVLTVRVRNWCGALVETDILVMKLMQIPA